MKNIKLLVQDCQRVIRILAMALVCLIGLSLSGEFSVVQAQGIARDFLIVADCSGSMDWDMPGSPGTKRIAEVKAAARALLPNNPNVAGSTGDFALVTFGGGCGEGDVQVSAWAANRAKYAGSVRQTINDKIQALIPNGATPLDFAVTKIIQMITAKNTANNNGRFFGVVIWTDGEPTCSGGTPCSGTPCQAAIDSTLKAASELGDAFKKLAAQIESAVLNPPPKNLIIKAAVVFITKKPNSPSPAELVFAEQFVDAINEAAEFKAADLYTASTSEELHPTMDAAFTEVIDPTGEEFSSCRKIDNLLVCAVIDDDQQDESFGNDDHIIHLGDDIEIKFVVRNLSAEIIKGLSIKSDLAWAGDPGIEVQEGRTAEEDLGDLEAGRFVVTDPKKGDLDLSIDLFVAEGTIFKVKVTLLSQDRELGSATFEFKVGAKSHF